MEGRRVRRFVQTQGLESTVIAILQKLPPGAAIIAAFVPVTIIFFPTLVDPTISVLATTSTKGISDTDETPKS